MSYRVMLFSYLKFNSHSNMQRLIHQRAQFRQKPEPILFCLRISTVDVPTSDAWSVKRLGLVLFAPFRATLDIRGESPNGLFKRTLVQNLPVHFHCSKDSFKQDRPSLRRNQLHGHGLSSVHLAERQLSTVGAVSKGKPKGSKTRLGVALEANPYQSVPAA